ncbi:MAG: response regulator transcription factor [Micromonosporaceae bacterium]|nr:response regulator transcription factor [Micromonosporaceae bacterium]
MRTVLVCVRTPVAARTIAACADRLGLGGAVRTAVSGPEMVSRLGEVAADVVLVDTAALRPDPVTFVRRALCLAPAATVVLFGAEGGQVAASAVAAGARGVIRSQDRDVVTSVAKAIMLLALPSSGRSVASSAARPAFPVNGRVPAGGTPAVAAPVGNLLRGAQRAAQPAGEEALRHPVPAGLAPGTETLVPAQRADAAARHGKPSRTMLTERELQVLRGMADGRSNAEIGRDLFVSEDTVKTHARRLFRKLGARDRAHAVAAGFRAGLVS